MIRLRFSLKLLVGLPVTFMVATSGCATKNFVRQSVLPVSQKLTTLETHTNEKIAEVSAKEQSDISQVNERISTTDQRVTSVASATQQAQGTADRAVQAADANSTKIASNSTAITTLGTSVTNALNYQLVEKADVTFASNKAVLTPEARATLDQVAAKALAQPRTVVELAGFADKRGTENYNLALSRKRAEVVQRYLVMQKVGVRTIHVVGLGEEGPPAGLEADLSPADTSQTELNRLARRVKIRIFGAGEVVGYADRSR